MSEQNLNIINLTLGNGSALLTRLLVVEASSSSLNPYSNQFEPFIKVLRIISILTSLINIRVLRNPKLKDVTYTYLFVISMGDLAYTSLMLFYSVLSDLCTTNQCNTFFYYIFLLLYVLISEYVTSSLAFFNIIMQVYISFQLFYRVLDGSSFRSYSHSNIYKSDSKTKMVIIVLLMISFLAYTPNLFTYHIETVDVKRNKTDDIDNNEIPFKLARTKFGKTNLSRLLLTCMTCIRIFFVIIVLLVVNICILVKFRKYMRNKTNLKYIRTSKFIYFLSDWLRINMFWLTNLKKSLSKLFRG
jgi:hypothetical protein